MYYRKQEDKKRLEKILQEHTGWPTGAYYREREGQRKYLKRYWKSQGKNSCWAYNKKYSHKVYRKFIKKNDYYTKKAYDLWWNVY